MADHFYSDTCLSVQDINGQMYRADCVPIYGIRGSMYPMQQYYNEEIINSDGGNYSGMRPHLNLESFGSTINPVGSGLVTWFDQRVQYSGFLSGQAVECVPTAGAYLGFGREYVSALERERCQYSQDMLGTRGNIHAEEYTWQPGGHHGNFSDYFLARK